jgi:hypothetical protein
LGPRSHGASPARFVPRPPQRHRQGTTPCSCPAAERVAALDFGSRADTDPAITLAAFDRAPSRGVGALAAGPTQFAPAEPGRVALLFASTSFVRLDSGALAYLPCGSSRRVAISTRGRLATPRLLTLLAVRIFARCGWKSLYLRFDPYSDVLLHLAGTAACRLRTDSAASVATRAPLSLRARDPFHLSGQDRC